MFILGQSLREVTFLIIVVFVAYISRIRRTLNIRSPSDKEDSAYSIPRTAPNTAARFAGRFSNQDLFFFCKYWHDSE